uniref:Uncharacterized protein n=1 Tax=Rhizophora mucronata TaxID=61149 RepID=A0A2P2L2M6_RHIMU
MIAVISFVRLYEERLGVKIHHPIAKEISMRLRKLKRQSITLWKTKISVMILIQSMVLTKILVMILIQIMILWKIKILVMTLI